MTRDFIRGVSVLTRAIQIIQHPDIRCYVVAPLLINILLFGGLIWFGYGELSPSVDWLLSYIPEFLDFLRWLIWLLIVVAVILFVFFIFTPITNIIAAPFNALLSERVEIILTGEKPTSNTSLVKMTMSSIQSQLGILIYTLIWSLGLLLISLIPVINFISPLLWFMFGSWLLSLGYFDYPMGNHEISFAHQKQQLKKRRGLMFGFGSSVMILTTIPLVNFVIMPLAVTGATIIWVEQLAINWEKPA